jgi:hypothetical protein
MRSGRPRAFASSTASVKAGSRRMRAASVRGSSSGARGRARTRSRASGRQKRGGPSIASPAASESPRTDHSAPSRASASAVATASGPGSGSRAETAEGTLTPGPPGGSSRGRPGRARGCGGVSATRASVRAASRAKRGHRPAERCRGRSACPGVAPERRAQRVCRPPRRNTVACPHVNGAHRRPRSLARRNRCREGYPPGTRRRRRACPADTAPPVLPGWCAGVDRPSRSGPVPCRR